MTDYRGYDLTPRSIVGGINIAKDGQFVDHAPDLTQARYTVDQMIREELPAAGDVVVTAIWGAERGPFHASQPDPHSDLSWCGRRIQFRHQKRLGDESKVTCTRCKRRLVLGRPLAHGARS